MIYFDNAATTVCSSAAADKILYMLKENFGNPSSLHKMGLDATMAISSAASCVASLIGADASEIIFTSGATESNNLCILGALDARKRSFNSIVYSAVEHESVLSVCKKAESLGYEAIKIAPLSTTEADIEAIANSVNEKTALVSLMLVNNETGAISKVRECVSLVKRKNPGTLVHCDLTAALGKIPINVRDLGIDLASMSAHKLHGPKGVGAAYIKKGVRISPILVGSSQQGAIRPGTESTALIMGFSEAAREAKERLQESFSEISKISVFLKQRLKEIDGTVIHTPENASPYIINFSNCRVRSEIMLHFLEMKEIYVSSGSACKKGEPSHVLLSAKKSRKEADTALRISLCRYNTIEEAKEFVDALMEGLDKIIPSYR